MTAYRSVILRCDYRAPNGRPCAREFSVESKQGNVSIRAGRVAALDAGWRREHGPSSCSYDLCSDHAHLKPGDTMTDWKKPGR